MAQLAATNIGTVEVGTAIGLSVHDYGMLCNDRVVEVDHVAGGITWYRSGAARANRINKWSKWKPVVHATMPKTAAILKGVNYGLNIPTHSYSVLRNYALTDLDITDDTTQIKWVYTPWMANYPSDISDFRNYQHGSMPLFNLSTVSTGAGIAWDGYGLLKWNIDISQAQATGGLIAADFNASDTWGLGVMLIDYESAGNEIVLIKANNTNILTSQSISIDITDLNASTYIVCLFLFIDDHYAVTPFTGGFAQIDNPTTEQIEAISGIFYLHPIDNGMVAIGLGQFTEFVMWSYIGTNALPSGFASSSYYDLISNYNYRPSLYDAIPELGIPARMVWGSGDFFAVEPVITFEPPNLLKWTLDIAAYIDNASWGDNAYRCLMAWDDIDNDTVCLLMKTVLVGSDRIMYFKYHDVTMEYDVGGEFSSGVALSEDYSTPNIIRLSNFTGAVKQMTVSVDGHSVFYDTTVNTVDNPPNFTFGYNGDTALAPNGLGYTYIDLRAYGQETT